MRKKKIDKDKLKISYLKEKLTQSEIAKQFGVSRKTISRRLRIFGIALRNKNEEKELRSKGLKKAYLEGTVFGFQKNHNFSPEIELKRVAGLRRSYKEGKRGIVIFRESRKCDNCQGIYIVQAPNGRYCPKCRDLAYKKKEQEWEIQHSIERREYKKSWWANHPEYQESWRRKNPDKVRKKGKRSMQKKENYERKLFLNEQRRMKKLNIEGSHTFNEWEKLKKEYNYICPACGKEELKVRLTEDHAIPITKYGTTDYIENIQPLCRSCNSRKNNQIVFYDPITELRSN